MLAQSKNITKLSAAHKVMSRTLRTELTTAVATKLGNTST